MPIEPEVTKESVAVAELIVPAIVETEGVHAVEAVGRTGQGHQTGQGRRTGKT